MRGILTINLGALPAPAKGLPLAQRSAINALRAAGDVTVPCEFVPDAEPVELLTDVVVVHDPPAAPAKSPRKAKA